MRHQAQRPGRLNREWLREVLPAGWKEVSHWIRENWGFWSADCMVGLGDEVWTCDWKVLEDVEEQGVGFGGGMDEVG